VSTSRSPLVLALFLLGALTWGPPARAANIQKSGPQVFPGKFQVGVHPVGFQVTFDDRSSGGYKFSADFSGLIKGFEKISLWLGGGVAYAHPTYSCFGGLGVGFGRGRGCAHDLQAWVFVRLTLEKIMKIPLVPYVQAGIGGDILVYSGDIGGGVPVRVGGGIHYWLLKNLGVGMETNFSMGPGIYPSAVTVGGCGAGSANCIGFFGNWDVGLGARFAF
jgi:hypothetical protein